MKLSLLANALKSYVKPVHASEFQNALHGVDGGHLLHNVMWPNDRTFNDIINEYMFHM